MSKAWKINTLLILAVAALGFVVMHDTTPPLIGLIGIFAAIIVLAAIPLWPIIAKEMQKATSLTSNSSDTNDTLNPNEQSNEAISFNSPHLSVDTRGPKRPNVKLVISDILIGTIFLFFTAWYFYALATKYAPSISGYVLWVSRGFIALIAFVAIVSIIDLLKNKKSLSPLEPSGTTTADLNHESGKDTLPFDPILRIMCIVLSVWFMYYLIPKYATWIIISFIVITYMLLL